MTIEQMEAVVNDPASWTEKDLAWMQQVQIGLMYVHGFDAEDAFRFTFTCFQAVHREVHTDVKVAVEQLQDCTDVPLVILGLTNSAVQAVNELIRLEEGVPKIQSILKTLRGSGLA